MSPRVLLLAARPSSMWATSRQVVYEALQLHPHRSQLAMSAGTTSLASPFSTVSSGRIAFSSDSADMERRATCHSSCCSQEHGAHEADDVAAVREDADHIASASDLTVQSPRRGLGYLESRALRGNSSECLGTHLYQGRLHVWPRKGERVPMPHELTATLMLGLQAFVVGLSGAMSPGPFLTVTMMRTMQHGPFSASLLLVGHAILEAVLLVGFAFGLQQFLRLSGVTLALALVGGAVLLWLGYKLIRGAVQGTLANELELVEGQAVSASHLGAVAQGAVVSISNPWWTLWWATIGVKLASDGLAIGPMGVVAFFVGHELADVAWYGFVITVVHKGKDLLTPRRYGVVMGVLGGALLYLGLRFVGQAFGVILPWLPL
jgi:threonine/homoserine/homoserine lactone efflux protein